jgi:hypothetical protein
MLSNERYDDTYSEAPKASDRRWGICLLSNAPLLQANLLKVIGTNWLNATFLSCDKMLSINARTDMRTRSAVIRICTLISSIVFGKPEAVTILGERLFLSAL